MRQAWGSVEPSCKVCRRPGNEDLRAQWGCDAPSTVGGVYQVTCPRCDGTDEECERCDGSGRAYVPRCPNALADASVMDALESFALLSNHGQYPVPGGRFAQTASFHRVCSVISAEKAKAVEMTRRK